MGARIIGGKLPSVTYIETFNSGGNGTLYYPYLGRPIGAASPKRHIVVCTLSSPSTVTGVTVGGVACNRLSTSVFNPTFWITQTPLATGTTADIRIDVSSTTPTQMTYSMWAVYDLRSIAAVATSTSTASPANLDLNVAARGVVIALAYSGNNGATYSWTGLTEDYEQTSGVNNVPRSGARGTATAAETPRTVRCSYSGSVSPRAAAISLR